MKITPKIAHYKKRISILNAKELLFVINNARLNREERYAVEAKDLFCKSLKVIAEDMNTDERQVGRWLHKARLKIIKQMFK